MCTAGLRKEVPLSEVVKRLSWQLPMATWETESPDEVMDRFHWIDFQEKTKKLPTEFFQLPKIKI